jgi:hypothetical protein
MSPFPLKNQGYNMIGFTGWFNSFDINNWHGSLRKMKNCNKGKSGKKDFLDYCPAEKERAIFFGKGYCKKVRERAKPGKKSKKG